MFPSVHLLPVCLLWLGTPSHSGNIQPETPCACRRPSVIHSDDTFVRYRCTVFPGEPFNIVLVDDIDDPSVVVGDVLENRCNNCGQGCGALDCNQTRTISKTDSGTVSFSNTVEAGAQAQINIKLAGSIHIQTSAAFSAGTTTETSVTETIETQCGGSVQPCGHTIFRMVSYQLPASADANVRYRWETALFRQVPNGVLQIGKWIPHDPPCEPPIPAHIDGLRGAVTSCIALPGECDPNVECRCGVDDEIRPFPRP